LALDGHFVEKRFERCANKGDRSRTQCVHCETGAKASLRFAMNVFAPVVGAVQVWEMNVTTFKDVVAAKETHGFEMLFEVKRNGRKGDKSTTYELTPADPIDDKLRAKLSAAALQDLETLLGDAAQGFPPQSVADVMPREPAIELSSAAHVIARLRDLNDYRARMHDFCLHFGVPRVADLPVSSLLAADAWLAEVERAESSGASDETDPFS
jgi:hypothetical protein